MQQIITAKLKLTPTGEQLQALRESQLACSVERQVAATYKGLLSVCHNPECCYTLHADLVGARNVTMRTLLVRHDCIRAPCQGALMHRTVKPKRSACEGSPSCGGVQM